MAVKHVHDIPRIICNRNQTKQNLQRHPVCLTDSDHEYILEEIEYRYKIEYEPNINNYGDEE